MLAPRSVVQLQKKFPADRVMDHLVKRYLLNIEVPVIEEISLIIKDKRKEKDDGNAEAQEKRL